MSDPADPTTVTKTYKSGRKASAQANLASRSKTPGKSRRRRNKGQNRSGEGTQVKSVDSGKAVLHWIFKIVSAHIFCFLQGQESDSASSGAGFGQERAPLPRQKDQNKSLLDKLTQEKLDSKTKLGNKRNDLSSGTSRRPL